ncbi:MAG: hypothetical protein KF819_40505 [Labilithrix sp.]|nr:hypothetical protein [Labilithrix sp.]
MRWLCSVGLVILLASGGCDKKDDAGAAPAPAASVSAAPVASTAPEDAGEEAGPKPLVMPERPIPRPQTTVGSGMPIEVQQKAIAYMVAMRAPRIDDPAADEAYATDLAAKLKPIILAMDSGADKAKMNRVEVIAKGRQIDLLMAGGCDDKTPMRAVVTRAGIPLAILASRGVLVVRCNDARIQCLQSTRDPEDVLCTTAPRHK